jgi:hypothetical protein
MSKFSTIEKNIETKIHPNSINNKMNKSVNPKNYILTKSNKFKLKDNSYILNELSNHEKIKCIDEFNIIYNTMCNKLSKLYEVYNNIDEDTYNNKKKEIEKQYRLQLTNIKRKYKLFRSYDKVKIGYRLISDNQFWYYINFDVNSRIDYEIL